MSHHCVKWIPPPEGMLKLNTKASVKDGLDFVSVGDVIWDADGVVQACLANKVLREGLSFAQQFGLRIQVRECCGPFFSKLLVHATVDLVGYDHIPLFVACTTIADLAF
ncbi:hypothetical protein L484_012671 [Morus notabilis]|uniref:Uncharacterized protein n=1 Tax=Morus notabilis TaxID=981085 RepID=W9QMN5_9ROSA|nr:hypothetical protein L484_012671 [Morus notabilis]